VIPFVVDVCVHPAANVPVEPAKHLASVQSASEAGPNVVTNALTTDAYAPNPACTVVVLFYLQKNKIKCMK